MKQQMMKYAERLTSSVGSISNTKAAVIGGVAGAAYSSFGQGSISGAITPDGVMNAAIGAGSMIAARKYGTGIYNKVEDRMYRNGLSKDKWNQFESEVNDINRDTLSKHGLKPNVNLEASMYHKKSVGPLAKTGFGAGGFMSFKQGAHYDPAKKYVIDHQGEPYDFVSLHKRSRSIDDILAGL